MDTLQRRAEALLQARSEQPAPSSSPDAVVPLLNALRLHQIELEVQNEDLRRALAELERSRERWFDLYETAPVGYCSVSDTGLVLQANRRAAELLGWSDDGLVKQRFARFIVDQDVSLYYSLRRRLLATGAAPPCEVRLSGGGEGGVWVQLTATLVQEPEQGQSLRIVLTDISERRRLAAALQAQQLAEQASLAKTAFLARMSHELRTPLHAILGFSSLLLTDDELPLASGPHEAVSLIQDAGMHLLALVDDLLDVSRIESGAMRVTLGPVDALAVLRDAVLGMATRPAYPQRIGVTALPDGETRAMVRADPTRLRQVVLNLLSNALKYSAAPNRVTAQLTRIGERWRISIVDSGIGMSAAQLADLFQPFNRLGREVSGIDGAGIGLFITRELVQAMGGQLHVRSQPGVGTEVQVDLMADEAGAPGGDPRQVDEAGHRSG